MMSISTINSAIVLFHCPSNHDPNLVRRSFRRRPGFSVCQVGVMLRRQWGQLPFQLERYSLLQSNRLSNQCRTSCLTFGQLRSHSSQHVVVLQKQQAGWPPRGKIFAGFPVNTSNYRDEKYSCGGWIWSLTGADLLVVLLVF